MSSRSTVAWAVLHPRSAFGFSLALMRGLSPRAALTAGRYQIGHPVHDRVDPSTVGALDIEAQQRLSVGRPEVEPFAAAEVYRDAIQMIHRNRLRFIGFSPLRPPVRGRRRPGS